MASIRIESHDNSKTNISRCICPHVIAKSANKISSNVTVLGMKAGRSVHGFRTLEITYLMCMGGDSCSLEFSGETISIEDRTRDAHSHRSGCASTTKVDYFCFNDLTNNLATFHIRFLPSINFPWLSHAYPSFKHITESYSWACSLSWKN